MSATSTAFIPLLLAAIADQQAGRLEAAAAGFAAVLALEPAQPQALLFGGVLASRTGETERAIDLLERAVAARPCFAEARFAHGNALWAAARRAAARAAWQHAIRLEPDHLGALLNLAQAQEQSGEAELAVLNCRAAVAARPELPQPWSALASALCSAGQPAEALPAAEAALQRDPGLASAHHHRGMALKALNRPAEATAALAEAVRLQPAAASSHLNLANLLHDGGDTAAALDHCRTALRLDPAMAEAHAVLGFLLTRTGDLPGAMTACHRAIALSPEMSQAHCNLGIAQLTAGDLPAGFARYEWRKRHPVFGREFFSLPDPEWIGQPLEGKRVVIVAEQGLGDAVMFARYARVLAARGAAVAIAADRRLLPLLRRVPGVSDAFPKSRTMPRFDYWVDQMSLPHLCGTTVQSVPSPGPYVSADPARSLVWAARLARDLAPNLARNLEQDLAGDGAARRRVGLVWAGNPLHTDDANRSCPARLFLPLAAAPGLVATSLQVGDAAAEAAQLGLRDWSLALADYGETAAAIDNLDLVITVDTSVAHVAGAMGKPTWVLLPHCPEWRWLRDRTDTPWYASMRLFRQPRPGDWEAVLTAVRVALQPS